MADIPNANDAVQASSDTVYTLLGRSQDASAIYGKPIDIDSLLDRCMGNQVFAMSLLSELAATGVQRMQEIRDFVNTAKYGAVAESAHSLKGAVAIVGAEPLRRLAALIEESAQTKTVEPLAALVHDLGNEMQRCLGFISAVRNPREVNETGAFNGHSGP